MARTFSYTTEVFDEYTDFPQTGDVDTIYIDASKNKAYRYDQSYYPISSEGVDIWGAIGSLSKGSGGGGGGGGGGASWGSINGTLSNQTDLNTALSAKQNTLTLTTTGTSGAATLVDSTLNIPQYSGGGGLKGVHTIRKLAAGESTCAAINAFASTGQSTTANRLTLAPYYPATNVNSVSISINIATAIASANVRILIYSDVNGFPNTKLYESANIDASTTGIKTALNNFSFVAGDVYWIGLHVSSASINITAIPSASSLLLRQSGVFNASYTYAVSGFTFGSAPLVLTTGSLINANPFLLQINS